MGKGGRPSPEGRVLRLRQGVQGLQGRSIAPQSQMRPNLGGKSAAGVRQPKHGRLPRRFGHAVTPAIIDELVRPCSMSSPLPRCCGRHSCIDECSSESFTYRSNKTRPLGKPTNTMSGIKETKPTKPPAKVDPKMFELTAAHPAGVQPPDRGVPSQPHALSPARAAAEGVQLLHFLRPRFETGASRATSQPPARPSLPSSALLQVGLIGLID